MKPELIVAGVLAIALALGGWYVSGLKGDITDLERKLQTCIAQGVVLSQKLQDQNDAVQALKNEADERLAKHATELAKARQTSKQAVNEAKIIYKTLPSTPGTSCEADRQSALDLINGVTR